MPPLEPLSCSHLILSCFLPSSVVGSFPGNKMGNLAKLADCRSILCLPLSSSLLPYTHYYREKIAPPNLSPLRDLSYPHFFGLEHYILIIHLVPIYSL